MSFFIISLIFLIFSTSSFAEPQRIISLAPSVTETLYYLKAQDRVVGVSNYCNWPEEARKKPKVGGMINPSYEKILALRPDLVIISKDVTPKEVYERLVAFNIKVHIYMPRGLKDLPEEVLKLGKAIGKEKEARKVISDFQIQIKEIKKVFNGQKALFIIWSEPLTVVEKSSHINEIMNLLGLKNIAKSKSINLEEIIKKNPDLIFLGSGHKSLPDRLLSQLKDTNAVKKGYVFYVSDKVYHLSPRIIEGIKEMAEIGYNLNNEKRSSTSKNKKQ